MEHAGLAPHTRCLQKGPARITKLLFAPHVRFAYSLKKANQIKVSASMTVIPRTHDKNMPEDELMALVESGDWDAKAIYAAKLVLSGDEDGGVEKGVAMLQEAYEAGSARATAELAFRHADRGGPLPQDLDKAEAYAAEAISRGNPFGWAARSLIAEVRGDLDAGFEAGKRFLEELPEGERDPAVVYSVGAFAHHGGRYDEAVPFYEEAAAAGIGPAAINLAMMINRAEVDLAPDRVIALLRVAAAAGEPVGAALFAHRAFYPNVYDQAQDLALQGEAVEILRDSLDEDPYHEVYHLLGYAFENGLGVAADPAEATKYYGMAAINEVWPAGAVKTLGVGRANIEYAIRLAAGMGTEANPEQAFKYCERAAELAQEAGEPEMAATAAYHAHQIVEDAGLDALRPRLLPLLKLGAEDGNPELMVPYAKALAERSGMKAARVWFVRGLACEDASGGIAAAELLLQAKKPAEAYAFAKAAEDLGASLPAELSALDAETRDKGLFRKGKSGAELYASLKEEITETVQTFGFHEGD